MPEVAPSATLSHRALLILLALTHGLAVMAWLVLSRFTADLISKELGDTRFADDPVADQTSAGWDERVPMLADIPPHGTIDSLLEGKPAGTARLMPPGCFGRGGMGILAARSRDADPTHDGSQSGTMSFGNRHKTLTEG